MPALRSSLLLAIAMLFTLVGGAGTAFCDAPDTVVTVPGLSLLSPAGVAMDANGNLYIADTLHNQIVIMDTTGTTNTIGDGTPAFSGDGAVPGATTQFNGPTGLAIDASGNVYIADTGNHRIRKISAVNNQITAASRVSTVAGNGIAGYSGDNGNAISASLNFPTGVAADSAGNIYIADNKNYRVRKVDSAGKITLFYGDGTATKLTVTGLTVAPAPAGDLYIADTGHNRILKIAAKNGVPSSASVPVAVAGNGTSGYSGDGGRGELAQLSQPTGVATDGADLYITDTGNLCVRKLSLAAGVISTRAGNTPESAITYSFSGPTGIAAASGNVYVADSLDNVIKEIYAPVSAATTAYPPGGSYIKAPAVTLTANRAATIYYTTDGVTNPLSIDPADAAQIKTYTGPFQLSTTTTVKFASKDMAGNKEVVNTANYALATPTTISPAPATYISAQSTMAIVLTANPSSTVYFTTDGKTPTVSSTKYTGPIMLPMTSSPTTTVVKFFAVDPLGNQEVVKSASYVLSALNTTPSFTGGAFTHASANLTPLKLVSNDPSVSIYYTSTDTTSGAAALPPTVIPANLYTPGTAIALPDNKETTVKYFAVDASGFQEPLKTQVYRVDTVVPVTVPSLTGGTFNRSQTVKLTADDPTATIFYTTNGLDPTPSSTKYTAPVSITRTTILKYFAMDLAGNMETVQTQIYTIDTVAPKTTLSVAGGTYSAPQTVRITVDDPTATIYYTINGAIPTTASTAYTGPIAINTSGTLKYFAQDTFGNSETYHTATYTIVSLTTIATPPGGIYASTQSISLGVNNPNAKIYYTTDGTTPEVGGRTTTKYSSPIPVVGSTGTTTVLKFFAVDDNGVIESVKTQRYTIYTTAASTVAKCGTGPGNSIKLIASGGDDPASVINYIANTPTTFAGVTVPPYTLATYTGPFGFSGNTIVKFFASDVAGNTELIKTAYCRDLVAPSGNPSIFLNPLPSGTAGSTLYVSGNVAPFATSTLDINGTPVTPSTKDGSFSHQLAAPATVNLTSGATTTSATVVPDPVSATIGIGTNTGVVGYTVRVPITLASGYQAAAVSVDIGYDANVLSEPTAALTPFAKTLNKTINSNVVTPGTFRLLITDQLGKPVTPLPDGVIAYATFNVHGGAGTTTPLQNLTVTTNLATDVGSATMVVAPIDGAVNVVSAPGNAFPDDAISLAGAMNALDMLLTPTTHPVDGAVDLNADGTVSISELQRVLNNFLGE